MLEKYKAYVDMSSKKKEDLTKKHKDMIKEYDTMCDDLALLMDTRDALVSISEVKRKKAIKSLTDVTQIMIQNTIGDRYNFSIDYTQSAGKPFCKFYITETVNGITSKQDISDSTGGGMQDVVSTALRYSFLILYDGGSSGPLILDEPARMIDSENSENYIEFLSELAKVSGKQIIMCTHNDSIKSKANNIISVEKK